MFFDPLAVEDAAMRCPVKLEHDPSTILQRRINLPELPQRNGLRIPQGGGSAEIGQISEDFERGRFAKVSHEYHQQVILLLSYNDFDSLLFR